MSIQEIHNHLISHNIKPSMQRVAIMQYLMGHRTHPAIDQIFNNLLPEIPTLSKTTVYNTVKLFYDKKAVLSLTIDEKMFVMIPIRQYMHISDVSYVEAFMIFH